MPKTATKLPTLSERQLKFLSTYRALEREMGEAPTLQSLLDAMPGQYSHRSGVQKMVGVLHDLGVIAKPHWTEGGTTLKGRKTLIRARRRGLL